MQARAQLVQMAFGGVCEAWCPGRRLEPEEGQGRELESCRDVFIQGATNSNCHFKAAF